MPRQARAAVEDAWIDEMVGKFNLHQTMHGVGRLKL